MNLLDGEFTTSTSDSFDIAITQESNWSTDGGYTFEDVTNIFELDVPNAKKLIDELKDFCEKNT